MKLKTLLFLLSLAAVVFCGFYFSRRSNDSDSKGKILNQSTWPKIILGKWNFEYQNKSQQDNWQYKGSVNFTSRKENNDSFYLTVTIKKLRYDEVSSVEGGGFISGEYFLDTDSTLRMLITQCGIVSAYGNGEPRYDLCDMFEFNQPMFDGKKELKLVEFDTDKIHLVGKNFVTDATLDYVFTKVSDK